MDDLISRDKIVQAVVKNPNMTASELYSMIVDAPIEYDADKVIDKLTESSYFSEDCNCDIVEYDMAIEIVKEGAVKE